MNKNIRFAVGLEEQPGQAYVALGRNGWFTPEVLEVLSTPAAIDLLVWSRRVGAQAPASVRLSREDARKLRDALSDVLSTEAKEEEEAVTPRFERAVRRTLASNREALQQLGDREDGTRTNQ